MVKIPKKLQFYSKKRLFFYPKTPESSKWNFPISRTRRLNPSRILKLGPKTGPKSSNNVREMGTVGVLKKPLFSHIAKKALFFHKISKKITYFYQFLAQKVAFPEFPQITFVKWPSRIATFCHIFALFSVFLPFFTVRFAKKPSF